MTISYIFGIPLEESVNSHVANTIYGKVTVVKVSGGVLATLEPPSGLPITTRGGDSREALELLVKRASAPEMAPMRWAGRDLTWDPEKLALTFKGPTYQLSVKKNIEGYTAEITIFNGVTYGGYGQAHKPTTGGALDAAFFSLRKGYSDDHHQALKSIERFEKQLEVLRCIWPHLDTLPSQADVTSF